MYHSRQLQHGISYHFNSPLDEYIDCVFVETFFSNQENQDCKVLIVPDNTVELIFTSHSFNRNTEQDNTSIGLGSHLSGLKNRPQWISLSGSPLITVRFKPGKLFYFTKSDAYHLVNASVSPLDLFGRDISFLENQLFEAKTPFDRLALLEKYFTAKLTSLEIHDSEVDKILHYIEQQKGFAKVRDLLQHGSLGQRQMEKKFKRYIGLSPKKYCRLIRFVNLVKHQNRKPHQKLTDLAYQFDFYDQSHFNREVAQFTAHSPRNFFSTNRGIQDDIF